MKNYRFLGDEAEILGRRLDFAREAHKRAKNKSWAKKYWRQVVDQLVMRWKKLPILHDGGAQVTIIPRWTVDYDYYEMQQEGNLYGVADRAYDKLFKHDANLEESWNNHRAARLAKAQ
jgi:hypothetical protein